MRCSAVLLTGGKSTRMGRDKALLEIDSEPLWRRQLETLRALAPEQLMLAGPPCEDGETVADEIPDAGPLGGVAAALRKCRSSHLVVLAVDLPRMTPDFLRSLLALCREGRGAVPGGPEIFEPLAAVYPAACAALASAALRSADFSMQNLVRKALVQQLLVARPILASETPLFVNLNSPADL
jgi:molybdenum cofactor guanylyltransferase